MTPAAPWRLRSFETLPSTSDLLAGLAAAGEPAGLAILARRQTGGRGSRGRAWASPRGALALSALVRPAGPASQASHWALLAGLALADALRHHAPGAALSLKWPNDVLLGGAKLGGILIDTATAPDGGLDWLVIGFGANLGSAPDLPDRTAAGLGMVVPPELVAATVLDRVGHWRRVALTEGPAAIRAAWLALAHPPGTHLRLRTGAGEVGGLFAGLADDGALLLQSGGRVRAFPTGEILQSGAA